eukprot:m.334196 g.334196  ORF g.334196 m.334196 type:complete len:181 (+) comp20505_c0_seq38:790-1332(+)
MFDRPLYAVPLGKGGVIGAVYMVLQRVRRKQVAMVSHVGDDVDGDDARVGRAALPGASTYETANEALEDVYKKVLKASKETTYKDLGRGQKLRIVNEMKLRNYFLPTLGMTMLYFVPCDDKFHNAENVVFTALQHDSPHLLLDLFFTAGGKLKKWHAKENKLVVSYFAHQVKSVHPPASI